MFKYTTLFAHKTNFKILYFWDNLFNINPLLKYFANKNNYNLSNNLLVKTYVLFYLKKEYLYTKLKYSRVPQVDISSGGAAGLLAGILGFIVTEKFGFELIDSGDFFLIIMYVILIVNVGRILSKIYFETEHSVYTFLLFTNIINYYITLITLIINIFKSYFIR